MKKTVVILLTLLLNCQEIFAFDNFYIRADAFNNFNNNIGRDNLTKYKNNSSYGFGLGTGYHFSEKTRIEIDINLHFNHRVNYAPPKTTLESINLIGQKLKECESLKKEVIKFRDIEGPLLDEDSGALIESLQNIRKIAKGLEQNEKDTKDINDSLSKLKLDSENHEYIKFSTISLITKAYYDIIDFGVTKIFVSVGGGLSRVKAKSDKDEWRDKFNLSYNIGAGMSFEMLPGLYAELQYNFYNLGKPGSMKRRDGKEHLETKASIEQGKWNYNGIKGHNMLIGFRFTL